MMMDEMAKVIAECSKASQHVPTVHDEVKMEVHENDVKVEQRENEEAPEVAPGVNVADSANWNEVEELIDTTDTTTSSQDEKRDEKMDECVNDEDDEDEEEVTHVKSEFS